jgi:prevent-host-death family protein
MGETLPLATVKTRLSEIVDRVAREQDRVVISRNGRPVAVLMSSDELDELEETLAIMSDPDLMAEIKDADESAMRGELVSIEEIKEKYGFKGE